MHGFVMNASLKVLFGILKKFHSIFQVYTDKISIKIEQTQLM